jgi:2-polyprenyl-6-methoxyphenol hydroxylase-like FAD-dependent oxidoreductase
LIVGAGISGLQIALDLASGNRTVYVAETLLQRFPISFLNIWAISLSGLPGTY